MTQQIIGIGSAPNDGTGDTLRDAFGKANDNFTELYVDKLDVSQDQPAATTGVTVLEVLPAASAAAFRQIIQGISNGDDPLTYNHIFAIGFNTSVESFHGNTEPGKATAILGFESNFKDGSNEYGPEIYFEFANLQRPFYARQIFDPVTTTIAAASNGQTLPQSVINVADTTNFPQYGWILIDGQTIQYTGKTATAFTGCTGGTLTLATGQTVTSRFRDNSVVHIDIGTDGYGSFSLFSGKLNTALVTVTKDQCNIRTQSIYLNSGTLVVGNVIQTNGTRFSPARRFASIDHAGSATITISADFVDTYRARITTSGTPTIAAPLNPTTGQELTIIIANRFGGVTISGPTWDPVFKLASGWTNPTPTFSRSITFVYDGTNWIELYRGAANVPN